MHVQLLRPALQLNTFFSGQRVTPLSETSILYDSSSTKLYAKALPYLGTCTSLYSMYISQHSSLHVVKIRYSMLFY